MTELDPTSPSRAEPDRAEPLSISVRERADAVTIVLAGEFDLDGLDPFTETLQELIEERPARIDIDAAAVRFIDSSGLKALLHAHHRVATAGSRLRLVVVSDAVRRVITLAGVGDDLLLPD
jgi:anti-sigma B factor antagonist